MSTESLLNAWLPGGVSGVFAICMHDSDFQSMQKLIKAEFPSLQQFKAIDTLHGLRTVDDFNRLQFPVSIRTRRNVLQSKPQSHIKDIVTHGPIGCSQSHMTIWKNSENLPGWVIIFESDVRAEHDIRAFISETTKTPFPTTEPQPGIIKFGWFIRGGKVKRVSKNLNKIVGGNSPGAQAYAIRGSDAHKYIKSLTPIDGHVDQELIMASTTGEAPSIYQTSRNVLFQRYKLQKRSMHPVFNLKLLFPDDPATSNTIIVLPWVLLIVSLLIVIVMSALYWRIKNKV